MKTLIFCLLSTLGFAQYHPAVPGQRMVVELSTDMQNWSMVLPYNSPRGFLRARPETCAAFVPWITAVDAMPGTEMDIYTGGVRNASCWAASVDLTPIAKGSANAGILISPRHVLFVTHYYPAINTEMTWFTQANESVMRTVTAFATVPDTASYHPDLTVGILDSDVPATIGFAKVLNETGLPSNWAGYNVPVVVRNREDKLFVADIGTWGNSVSLSQPILASRLAKYNPMVSGDSGSPVCLVHDNKLVLVALVTFGGAGRGANISRHIAAINSAMTSLGGNHQLTTQTP
jgi:hypothetical protein